MRTEEILNRVVGPNVLDVGCAGHMPDPSSLYWLHGCLRKKFRSVTGLDVNEANIETLMNLGYENLFVASAENFNLQKKFDTIVAGELIEHLSNPGKFFECCSHHLNPGGRVVLSTPYAFSLMYVLYAFLKYPHTCQNQEHTVWLCPNTLIELASRYGFLAENWELVEDYEFDNPSLLYRIFARLITTLGRLILPERLRKNNMLFVFSLKNQT